MKKTTLLKTMLLLCALVVGSNAWAADVVYKTQQFSSSTYSAGVSGYTDVSFDNTYGGFTCNYSNFNNNNKGWNYVKCGGKNGAYTGTITTNDAIDEAITKVVVTIDAITAANVTSIKLYKSANKSSWTELGSFDRSTGAKEVVIASPAADLYYKIEFVCTKHASQNGLVTVSKVQFYTQSYDITAESNNDSYGTVSLEGFTITATPNSGYRVISGTDGYTVSSGTATVTNNGDNTFTVEPSTDCTITINFEAIPSHTATFSVNGIENSTDYLEGEDILFPSDPSSLGGKVFKGWIKTPIVGATNTEPAEYYTSGVMGTDDVTYYAVFAKESTGEGNVTLTITKDTDDFPTEYGTANTFTEYTLEGKKFKIQQGYVSGTKLQWRAAGNKNGTGTIYNTDVLNKIQRVVLTYDSSDANKNFTLKVGDTENPSSGTEITPSTSSLVYTFDCSGYNKSYFVMTNGSGAGYLESIAITYKSTTTIYTSYCTSITASVTTNKGKWTSFTPSWNATLEDGATAYIITDVEDDVITATAVDVLKASEGYFIKGAEATTPYTVYASAEDANDVTGNLIVGCTSAETIDADTPDSNHKYVLGTTGEGVSGLFLVNSSVTVAAGKAYLNTQSTTGAHTLSLDFEDGGATGINTIKHEAKGLLDGDFYNLNGQRVAQPTKGLYIINGRKVVIR